jgi:CBS domain containing-hemolysin-like protein
VSHALVAVFGAALAAAWAALLALAEGALAAEPRLLETALPRGYAEKPERLRRALSLGRIILLGLTAVALSGAVRWWTMPFPRGVAWALALVGLIALAADLLPRVAGLLKARSLGPWAVGATAGTLALAVPVFIAAGILDRAFARMFGVATPKGQGSADPAQRDMLLGVFALADTMVSEVMTPRVDLIGVDVNLPFDELVRQTAAAEHARLPVYDGDLDHIVGVLYVKDLLPHRFGSPGRAPDWKALIRPVEIVPEVKTLDQQLRDFQRGPSHLAVVVDEFGGTAGIVTLEDVLEEIVGEIADEYDPAIGPLIAETQPGVFQVHGRAALDELSTALGVTLEHEEVTTAGGYVYALLGHVPVAGETITIPGYKVTVEKVEKRSVVRLRCERIATPAEEGVA